MTTAYINHDLFGGAIKVNAPSDLVDVSDLRQVPDNQEVFVYPKCGVSIIVEVLQAVSAVTDEDAVKFHFDSLAHDNSAEQSEFCTITVGPSREEDTTPPVIVLQGTQTVKKFNSQRPDKVEIFMALYRIKKKSVDLVVTWNVPVDSPEGAAVTASQKESVMQDFNVFTNSLRIIDYNLFA